MELAGQGRRGSEQRPLEVERPEHWAGWGGGNWEGGQQSGEEGGSGGALLKGLDSVLRILGAVSRSVFRVTPVLAAE